MLEGTRMDDSSDGRTLHDRRARAARNQSLFRSINERIEQISQPAFFTAFICECLSEQCVASIPMTLEEYESVRANGSDFVVVHGHAFSEIEDIVDGTDRYLVVR